MNYTDFIDSKRRLAKPMGFECGPLPDGMFPFQKAITKWAVERGRAAVFAECGLGKAQPVDELVLTPTGFTTIGGIRAGDTVTGSDGMPQQVIGVFPQGIRQIVKMTFSDGTSARCDLEHLWRVKSQGHRWYTKTTSEMMQKSLKYKGGQSRFFIPVVAPVAFSGHPRPLPIDPYTLGVLIGDGSLVYGTPIVTNPDREVIDYCVLPDGCDIKELESVDRCQAYSFVGGTYKNSQNPVTEALRELKLFGKRAEYKFVPEDYKYASPEARLAILQGLLDTDGYADGPTIEFSSASARLSEDVAFLVRSLGGTASTPTDEASHYTKDGKRVKCLNKHRTIIKLPNGMAPFRLARKRGRYNPLQRKNPYKAIKSIEPAGTAECVCISVSNSDQLYVTSGFSVTHNTITQLAWAEQVVKHSWGAVMLHCPLGVRPQTVAEAAKFGISEQVYIADSQADVQPRGIAVANYDKLHKFDASKFAGVVLDESSILKNFTGKIKRQLLDSYRQTPYRLACTATPAPNDQMELGNHADFLGVMPSNEMLSRWFVNDTMKAGGYRLKKHARSDFWAWVSSWAVCLRMPSDIGEEFDDSGYILPPLRRTVVEVVHQEAPADGWLFPSSVVNATTMHRSKRQSVDQRSQAVCDLVRERKGRWVVWCDTNYESQELFRRLSHVSKCCEVHGAQPSETKEALLHAFTRGDYDVIVSKPKIAGFGMNWQGIHQVAFVGLSYSFEQYYQAIRRCWRFGQKNPVDVFVINTDAETAMMDAVMEKEVKHGEMATGMAEAMKQFQTAAIHSELRPSQYHATKTMEIPSWIASTRQ